MPKISRFLALGAFFVSMAVALAACGGDSIPGNAVAKVGGNAITKDTFNHWMQVAAISSAGSSEPDKAKAASSVPDAPDFKKCIEEKAKSAPKPAKGQP
ncbi:MAG: peptidylprolyl isomerase, partial [Solirubrobacterales bacterium]|nr:peptidylprolyl isomerase [Solirubrobacterales bacterium]